MNIQSFQSKMALEKMIGVVGLCSPREKGIVFKLLETIYLLLNLKDWLKELRSVLLMQCWLN